MSGLWRHAALFGEPSPAERALSRGWTLGEGDTPLDSRPDLAAELGLASLHLKREDLNPGGSHKDRGLLYQVAYHHQEEPGTLVISSSGNAAASAAAACNSTGDRLVAFVAPGTAPHKLQRLACYRATVVECLKPMNFARYAARVFGLVNLRGTQDPISSVGYRSLGAELAQEAPLIEAVATFSSSGISLEGLADGLTASGKSPALWAVQSGVCIGIVRELAPQTEADLSSPAGRLGIRTPPQAAALAQRLTASGGGAVAVGSEPVHRWMQRLAHESLSVAPEGAAVLAGIESTEALRGQRVVAIMTGTAGAPTPTAKEPPEGINVVSLSSYLEVRGFFIDKLGLEPL